MAHGLIFIAFVLTGLLVGMAANWTLRTWLLALLASIGAALQCDFAHMGGSDTSTGRRESVGRAPSTRPIDGGNDVTDLGA